MHMLSIDNERSKNFYSENQITVYYDYYQKDEHAKKPLRERRLRQHPMVMLGTLTEYH